MNWENGAPHLSINPDRATQLRNAAHEQFGNLDKTGRLQQWEQSAAEMWRSSQSMDQNTYGGNNPYNPKQNFPSTQPNTIQPQWNQDPYRSSPMNSAGYTTNVQQQQLYQQQLYQQQQQQLYQQQQQQQQLYQQQQQQLAQQQLSPQQYQQWLAQQQQAAIAQRNPASYPQRYEQPSSNYGQSTGFAQPTGNGYSVGFGQPTSPSTAPYQGGVPQSPAYYSNPGSLYNQGSLPNNINRGRY